MNPLPPDRSVNLVIWAVVATALLVWVAVALVSPRVPRPVELVRLARRSFVSRWLLVLWWMWLGWHLFVRTTY